MLLAALCTSALAFAGHAGVHRSAPSRSAISAESDSSSFAYGLPGSCEPFPSFDPFGFALADEGEVRWYREAEVTHGRVSMLAVVGMFSSEAGFHPFVDAPIMGASIDHVELTSPALTALLAVLAGACEAYRVQIGIKDPRAVAGDPDTPEETVGWSTERAISLRDDYEPGELGFDPLRMFPDKPAEREEMLLKELNNGRLAMLAAAGIIAQELVDRKPIFESLFDH